MSIVSGMWTGVRAAPTYTILITPTPPSSATALPPDTLYDDADLEQLDGGPAAADTILPREVVYG